MFSIENQMQVIPLARNPKEKTQKTNMFCFFLNISYPLTVLLPSKFKWRYDTSRIWIAGHCLFFFCLGFLLYLRYAIHVLEYGSQKSFIVTHISTCFLVNFVFCCFLCVLICLFHVLWFISLFHVFSCFLMFMYFHVFSFCVFSSLEKNITNPDHLQFDTLLSFADTGEIL